MLTIFFLYKVPYVGLPYYWDEAWSYVPAIHLMHEHGPSLLPQSMPPEVSRGHPLLFYFVASTWMKLFGEGRQFMHMFPLSLSIATLIFVFILGKELVNSWIGLLAATLTACCEPFLAQSGMLLPEMMLTLFSCISILLYIRNKPIGYVISASAALFVKESALVLIIAVIATEIVVALWSGTIKEIRLRRMLILVSPIVIVGVFFIQQRIVHGWFLFPEHIDLMQYDIRTIVYKLKLIYYEVFERQGMTIATYSFSFAVIIFMRTCPTRIKVLLILLYVTAIKVLFGRWTLPELTTLIIPVVCFLIIGLVKFNYVYKLNEKIGRTSLLIYIFMCGYFLFSSLNFYTNRYLLITYPIFIVATLTLVHAVLPARLNLKTTIALGLIMLTVLITQIDADGDIGDTRLSYRDDIKVHQDLIHYCEEEDLHLYHFTGSFILSHYMSDPRSGYLKYGEPFRHVGPTLQPNTKYLVLTHSSDDDEKAGITGFERRQEFRSNNAWAVLYERKGGDH